MLAVIIQGGAQTSPLYVIGGGMRFYAAWRAVYPHTLVASRDTRCVEGPLALSPKHLTLLT